MSDNEDIVQEPPVKEKKPRTEAQIRATERMLEKRREIDAIKAGHREALKTEKAMKLQDKVNKIKEVETKLQAYQTESEEEEIVTKPKPKPKKKKKIVYQEEESSESEEEIVIVKPKKKKSVKKTRRVYEDESEEEQSLPRNVQKSSNEQLKHDLQTERIHTALRSLGYLA